MNLETEYNLEDTDYVSDDKKSEIREDLRERLYEAVREQLDDVTVRPDGWRQFQMDCEYTPTDTVESRLNGLTSSPRKAGPRAASTSSKHDQSSST